MSERLRRTISPLLAVCFIATGCGEERAGREPGPEVGSTDQAESVSSYTDITVEEFREMMAEGDLLLVNVHIPFEGDIPGTDRSIRFDEIADHLNQLPQDRDSRIVLYCRSGGMSEEAATVLASLGYTDVSNLEGGFRAWAAAGYEMER